LGHVSKIRTIFDTALDTTRYDIYVHSTLADSQINLVHEAKQQKIKKNFLKHAQK